jgi:hypothetical protein
MVGQIGRRWLILIGIAGSEVAMVLFAFGRFLVSNLQLRSDYLLFIAGLFTIGAVAAGCLLLGRHHRHEDD